MKSLMNMMTPGAREQAFYQGLLQMGPALMAAGGPSLTPGGGLGALAQAGAAFGRGVQGHLQNERMNAYRDYQINRQRDQDQQVKAAHAKQQTALNNLKGQYPEFANHIDAGLGGQVLAHQLKGPESPEMTKDANGYQRYVTGPNAGEKVFPDVQKEEALEFVNYFDPRTQQTKTVQAGSEVEKSMAAVGWVKTGNYTPEKPETPGFQGNGGTQQAMNALTNYRMKKEQGLPISRREELMAQWGQMLLSRPQTITTPEGQMFERPGMDVSDFYGGNQEKGVGALVSTTTDDRKRVSKARDLQRNTGIALNSLGQLTESIRENGLQLTGGEAQGKMKALHTDVMMQMKNLFELGALQQADIDILSRLIPDPTSFNSMAPLPWTTQATMLAQMDQAQKLLTERLEISLRDANIGPAEAPEGYDEVKELNGKKYVRKGTDWFEMPAGGDLRGRAVQDFRQNDRRY